MSMSFCRFGLFWVPVAVLLGAAACSSTAALKPVQRLDERTGVTVASLPAPMEFVQGGMGPPGRHPSFAYLGPIEWDNMGQLSYGLWLHVAPGNDRQILSLTDSAELQVALDDGPMTLSRVAAPLLAHPPYEPVASWGQTAYFAVNPEQLERLARSAKCILQLRGADGATVDFQPQVATHKLLTAFLRARGLTGD
jgi:hypothetical protein